jgi:non-heme chloroperoxidase
MMGGAKAHDDGIVAFSQTDFTEDLKKISVPVLKTYKGFPHGMPTTQAETINADLLSWLQSGAQAPTDGNRVGATA